MPPQLALQYYDDWVNMQNTGAITQGLPSAATLPHSQWELMAQREIPPADRVRRRAQNPTFDVEPHSSRSSRREKKPGTSDHEFQNPFETLLNLVQSHETLDDKPPASRCKTLYKPSPHNLRSYLNSEGTCITRYQTQKLCS